MKIMAYSARKKAVRLKALAIGRLLITYTAAKPRTLWWRSPSTNSRVDTLVAFNRTYVRAEKLYYYTVTLGRFKVDIAWVKKKNDN